MIIDKVKPYWTDEELQEIEEIRADQDALLKLMSDRKYSPDQRKKFNQDFFSFENRITVLENNVDARYYNACSDEQVLADAKEIVAAIEKEDFLKYLEVKKKRLIDLNEDSAEYILKYTEESFDNCYRYILYYLKTQLNALRDWDEIFSLAKNRAACWYADLPAVVSGTNPFLEAFLAIPTSAALSIFDESTIDSFSVDEMANKATFTSGTVEITIENYDSMAGKKSLSSRKIFDTAKGLLIDVNYCGDGKGIISDNNIILSVYIDLKDYLTACGENLKPVDYSEKETKRVLDRISWCRRVIDKDLRDLEKGVISGSEKRGKNVVPIGNLRFISSHQFFHSVENGKRREKIKINFDVEGAKYLINNCGISWYSMKLLKIASPNAYAMAIKIVQRSSIYSNIRKGVESTLSVHSLLKSAPGIPSYDDLMKANDRHWKVKIKKRLEEALNELIEVKYLKKWEYRNPRVQKGIKKLTPKDADKLPWRDFELLDVDYVLDERQDVSERMKDYQKRVDDNKNKIEQREIKIEAARRNKKEKAEKNSE